MNISDYTEDDTRDVKNIGFLHPFLLHNGKICDKIRSWKRVMENVEFCKKEHGYGNRILRGTYNVLYCSPR